MIGPTIASGVILNPNILREYIAISDVTMFSYSSTLYGLYLRYRPIHLAYAQPWQWTCTELNRLKLNMLQLVYMAVFLRTILGSSKFVYFV